MSTLPAPTLPLATPSPARKITAEEFVARYHDAWAELVKGVVKELPMPFPKHGKVSIPDVLPGFCVPVARLFA